MSLLYLTEGNTSPSVQFNLTDIYGNTVDITGCALVFRMQAIGASSPLELSGTCSIDSPLEGICHYTWATDDLDTPGSYNAQLNITFPDNTNQDTTIMGIEVVPALT